MKEIRCRLGLDSLTERWDLSVTNLQGRIVSYLVAKTATNLLMGLGPRVLLLCTIAAGRVFVTPQSEFLTKHRLYIHLLVSILVGILTDILRILIWILAAWDAAPTSWLVATRGQAGIDANET